MSQRLVAVFTPFENLTDPRVERTRVHDLFELVVVAVCGGIAAYKVADVVSKLVQLGAGVTVVMTVEAQKFVTPLTFQALSGRPVRTRTFELVESSDPQHIGLIAFSVGDLLAPSEVECMYAF